MSDFIGISEEWVPRKGAQFTGCGGRWQTCWYDQLVLAVFRFNLNGITAVRRHLNGDAQRLAADRAILHVNLRAARQVEPQPDRLAAVRTLRGVVLDHGGRNSPVSWFSSARPRADGRTESASRSTR